MSTEDIDGLDDVENSLLHYNQAIIHYHMRQYSEAILIGERLYQFLEPFGTFSSLQHNILVAIPVLLATRWAPRERLKYNSFLLDV